MSAHYDFQSLDPKTSPSLPTITPRFFEVTTYPTWARGGPCRPHSLRVPYNDPGGHHLAVHTVPDLSAQFGSVNFLAWMYLYFAVWFSCHLAKPDCP